MYLSTYIVIGLTRPRDEGYIGFVFVYVHIVGLTRQTDRCYIGCLYLHVRVIQLTRQRHQGYVGLRRCVCVYVCYRTNKTKR